MCENCRARYFGTDRPTVSFGPYNWLVLEERDGKALLLCEDIIERRVYNATLTPVTWEDCALRAYLNGEFLDGFSEEVRARIALTHNENPDNTWGMFYGEPFNTPGGKPTDDHVFLLSVPEILKYFPGLELHTDSDDDKWYYEADKRLVVNFNTSGSWWWLRSPGSTQGRAAYVYRDGNVRLDGNGVSRGTGGVRPALWLNLKS